MQTHLLVKILSKHKVLWYILESSFLTETILNQYPIS